MWHTLKEQLVDPVFHRWAILEFLCFAALSIVGVLIVFHFLRARPVLLIIAVLCILVTVVDGGLPENDAEDILGGVMESDMSKDEYQIAHLDVFGDIDRAIEEAEREAADQAVVLSVVSDLVTKIPSLFDARRNGYDSGNVTYFGRRDAKKPFVPVPGLVSVTTPVTAQVPAPSPAPLFPRNGKASIPASAQRSIWRPSLASQFGPLKPPSVLYVKVLEYLQTYHGITTVHLMSPQAGPLFAHAFQNRSVYSPLTDTHHFEFSLSPKIDIPSPLYPQITLKTHIASDYREDLNAQLPMVQFPGDEIWPIETLFVLKP
ncbi:hypothetical protein AAVH_16675 [Aphelenchoides avenae]|nr:hypothetical protein AAVH_16675 [Aphelenchus avenae]